MYLQSVAVETAKQKGGGTPLKGYQTETLWDHHNATRILGYTALYKI